MIGRPTLEVVEAGRSIRNLLIVRGIIPPRALHHGRSPGLRMLPSRTNGVFHIDGTDLVIRVAPRDSSSEALERELAVADQLASAGVQVTKPAVLDVVSDSAGNLATVWDWENTVPGAINWEAVGNTVRDVHDVGTEIASRGAYQFSELTDLTDVRASILNSAKQPGLLVGDEQRRLESWIDELSELERATRGDHPLVLSHGDLWDKNIIKTARGEVISDLDTLGLAPRDLDMSFVRSWLFRGQIQANDVAAFESGYGMALPTPERAQILRYMMHLRRTAWLVSRRMATPSTRENARDMLNDFAQPGGPRKDRFTDQFERIHETAIHGAMVQ